jgi:hypothetical protein
VLLSTLSFKDQCDDYYKVLGVKSNASNLEIRKGWHQKSLQLHPDKQRGLTHWKKFTQKTRLFFNGFDSAQDAFLLSSTASEVLMDPEKRKQHDVHLQTCREVQKQRWRNNFPQSHGFQGSISRNIYFFAMEKLDGLSQKLPIIAIPVGWLIGTINMIITYHQSNGTFKLIVFLLFILFTTTVLLPMVVSAIITFTVKTPFRMISKSLGFDKIAEKRKAEGLKRARERQAKLFNTSKEQ